MRTAMAIVELVALLSVLTCPAWLKGADPDPYPVAARLTSIEAKLDRLEKKVDALAGTSIKTVSGCPCGCESGNRCTCGANCPTSARKVATVATSPVTPNVLPSVTTVYQSPPVVVSQPVQRSVTRASYVTGQGHTHTCPRCGTTWDHGANPSHNCPNCGTTQFIQDSGSSSYRSVVQPTYTPRLTLFGGRLSGAGCANGKCAIGR